MLIRRAGAAFRRQVPLPRRRVAKVKIPWLSGMNVRTRGFLLLPIPFSSSSAGPGPPRQVNPSLCGKNFRKLSAESPPRKLFLENEVEKDRNIHQKRMNLAGKG